MARQLVVSILGDTSRFRRSLDGAVSDAGKFRQRIAKVGLAAGTSLASGLVAGMTMGIKGVLEGASAQAKLDDALSRSTKQIQAQREAIIKNSTALQHSTKFSQEDALAIGTKIAALGGLSKAVTRGTISAVDMTNVVADMAQVMGVDGTAAAAKLNAALSKPESAARSLRAVGISLTKSEEAKIKTLVKSGDTYRAQAILLDLVKAKTEGAAAAFGETLEGKVIRAKNAFGEASESLATGLLPMLESAAAKAQQFGAWMEAHPKAAKALAIAVGGVAAAFLLAAGAAIAFDIAASPITVPLLAIVAVLAAWGFAIERAWKNSETFREVAVGAYNTIKDAAVTGLQWMTKGWVLYNVAVLTGIQKMLQAAGKLPSWLGGGAFDAAAEFVGGMIDGIKRMGDAVDALANKARAADWELQKMADDMGAVASANALSDPAFNQQLADDLAGRPRAGEARATGGGGANPFAGLSEGGSGGGGAKAAAKVKAAAIKVGKAWVDGIRVGIDHKATEVKDAISRVIDAAKDRLTKAKDLAKSIKDLFAYTFNAMQFDSSTGVRSATLIYDLEQQLKKTERFAKVIAELRKKGFKGSALTNLVAGGPGNLGAAEELLQGNNAKKAMDITHQIDVANGKFANSEVLRQTGTDLTKDKPVKVIFDIKGADGEMKNLIKKIVRVEGGGSVQVAFGKG